MPESERRSRHFSPSEKSKAVLRILGGESAGDVAVSLGVQVNRVEAWQSTFLAGGLDALEKKAKERRRTALDKFREISKPMWQWVGLFLVLAVTILFLVRFLNSSGGD